MSNDDFQDEIDEAYYDENPDMLTPEEVFKMVLLNKKNKTRIWIELKDKDGDVIDHAELMEELVNYTKDKLSDENGNQLLDQIMPLMSQSLVSGLGRLIGLQSTALMITNPNTRMSLIYMMMISFVMYKMVQVQGLTIHTYEEEVSDEEIEEIERKSKATSVASMGAMLGMDYKEILQEMVNSGELTRDDINGILGEEPDEENE